MLAQGAEFLRAKQAGLVDDSHVVGEIGQVLAGDLEGRQSADQITVYKSLGHVVQDPPPPRRCTRPADARRRAAAGTRSPHRARPHGRRQGKGAVAITLRIPAADAPAAGALLLTLPIVIANTDTVANTLTGLTATDALGPVPLTARDDPVAIAYSCHWSATRAVKGDLVVRHAPRSTTPPARGPARPTPAHRGRRRLRRRQHLHPAPEAGAPTASPSAGT